MKQIYSNKSIYISFQLLFASTSITVTHYSFVSSYYALSFNVFPILLHHIYISNTILGGIAFMLHSLFPPYTIIIISLPTSPAELSSHIIFISDSTTGKRRLAT